VEPRALLGRRTRQRDVADSIGGDRAVYSRLGRLQAARLFQQLQTRLRGKLTVGKYDARDGEGEQVEWNVQGSTLPLLA